MCSLCRPLLINLVLTNKYGFVGCVLLLQRSRCFVPSDALGKKRLRSVRKQSNIICSVRATLFTEHFPPHQRRVKTWVFANVLKCVQSGSKFFCIPKPTLQPLLDPIQDIDKNPPFTQCKGSGNGSLKR